MNLKGLLGCLLTLAISGKVQWQRILQFSRDKSHPTPSLTGMVRVVKVAATGAMCIALVGLVHSPAGAEDTEKRSSDVRYAGQAFNATNANRAQHREKRLKRNACLQKAAVRQAKAMAREQAMYHQDLRKVLRQCKLRLAGENVAFGFDTGKSVVNDGWMNSSGHRANILNDAYQFMGVGAWQGEDGLWYAAQVFGRK